MTTEQQCIAIAEACGWTWIEEDYTYYGFTCRFPMKRKRWTPPNGDKPTLDIPDYLNDLNAMHEAWLNVILPKPSLCLEYYQNLCTVVETKKDGTHIFGVCLYDKVTNATAAERAEAFLRTIGKWEDAK